MNNHIAVKTCKTRDIKEILKIFYENIYTNIYTNQSYLCKTKN
jgi:hypothetical protein